MLPRKVYKKIIIMNKKGIKLIHNHTNNASDLLTNL